jgi:hypothetical protein
MVIPKITGISIKHMYLKALKELRDFHNYDNISIIKVEFWLLKHTDLFKQVQSDHSCFLKKVLPCYCPTRNLDCLFVEVYNELDKISKLYRDNLDLKIELLEYQIIRNDKIKLKKWMLKNEEFGLQDFVFFDTFPILKDVKLKLRNGKIGNEFNHLNINISGHYFENTYLFINIFNKHFFIEKICADRYENWKQMTSYVE